MAMSSATIYAYVSKVMRVEMTLVDIPHPLRHSWKDNTGMAANVLMLSRNCADWDGRYERLTFRGVGSRWE